jgi:hypothetical protein
VTVRSFRTGFRRGLLNTFVVLTLPVLLAACASTDRGVALADEIVTPMTVGDSADVPAEQLADAMLRAGFQRDEILRHGLAVRNALAESGGARIRSGNIVEALMAIHGKRLYVVSRTRGTFIVELPIA